MLLKVRWWLLYPKCNNSATSEIDMDFILSQRTISSLSSFKTSSLLGINAGFDGSEYEYGAICHCYSSGINLEEEGVEMFLNPKILKKLLKEAYKHRTLYLACKAESLYIAAGYWEMEFLKEYIPKETLGDIVALSGMLPEDGHRFHFIPANDKLFILF